MFLQLPFAFHVLAQRERNATRYAYHDKAGNLIMEGPDGKKEIIKPALSPAAEAKRVVAEERRKLREERFHLYLGDN